MTATQKLFAEYGEALADIKSQPNEAAANSVVAQYLCFVRGDWQSGLPAMAKCDLESLKSVAAEEIALLTTEKSEPKKGFALAGKWWAAADKHENVSGSGDAIRLHAASIYHDVLQSLQDPLERRLAENRIEPYKAVVAVKSREGVRTSSEVFLSDLEERDPFVGYGVFGKNGELGYEGLKIVVGGQVSPKGISVHPFSGGTSRVTYKVPEGCTHFEGRAAIADGRKPQQTAVIFRVLNERDDVLWKSRPILGKGAGEECSIALNGAKTVTLTVECPGIFDYAYAVWVDPVLLWQGSTLTNAARSSLVLPGKANEKFDFNGHAYWFPEEQTNQIQAKLAAEKVGGVLVVIDDEAENNFIAQHVRGTSWIGIRKSANGLMPVSGGGKITYSSWDHKAGQPSNFAGETAVSTSQAGLWHDHFATDELYYVVEWPYELPRNSGTASVSNNPVQPPPERLTGFRGSIGKTIAFKVTGATNGSGVWGGNPYTADSQLARAAVHAGVLKPGESGIVNVTILPGQQSYEGIERNGVATSRWGSYGLSYRIESSNPAGAGVALEGGVLAATPGQNLIYLSDIPELEAKVVHFGFGKGTIRGENNPIRSIIDGKKSPHGLYMHPGDGPNGDCFVKYSLPKGAKRFSATTTLDQGGSFDHCGIGFEVIADGKSVWKSKTINKDNQFDKCDIAIEDCRNLELRTYTVTKAFGGHAVWIEPCLTFGESEQPAKASRPTDAIVWETNGHAYKVFPVKESISWTDAQQRCVDMGGSLACGESEEEFAFLYKLKGGVRVWLGGREINGKWLWTTGKPAPIPAGKGGDNKFLATTRGTGRIARPDLAEFVEGFICEWPGPQVPSEVK